MKTVFVIEMDYPDGEGIPNEHSMAVGSMGRALGATNVHIAIAGTAESILFSIKQGQMISNTPVCPLCKKPDNQDEFTLCSHRFHAPKSPYPREKTE